MAQADRPGCSRSVWALAPSPAACACVCVCVQLWETWPPGSWQGACMETPAHTPEPAPAQILSPSDTCPSAGPMAGWCLWEKTSRHQMGAGGSRGHRTKLGPPFTRLRHREPGRLERQGPAGRGQTEALARGHTGSCHCLPSWALSVVTRDRGQRCGINLRSCHGQQLPTLAETRSQLSVAGEAQAPVPTETSQPRDEGQEAVAPWPEMFGRCSGGPAAGGGARSAGQRDGDATGGLAARVGLLG